MNIGIITLFPEIIDALNYGVIGRAITDSLAHIHVWNPRDFAVDKHKTVDDKPYGGGPGMLMKVEPIQKAIHAAKEKLGQKTKVIYVSPQGKKFDQEAAKRMSLMNNFIFVAGRYEGIDERLIQSEIDEEWSIGDYVLSGGEFAILVLIDAIIRLRPEVLGDEKSALEDSFMKGLLDHPHYTRPEKIDGVTVPKVLLSGDHKAIAQWRLKQALGRTWLRRPNLIEKLKLTFTEKVLLNEFKNESGK